MRAATHGNRWLAVGAIAALVAVAAGAFGAHALAPVLSDRALRSYETAARYQMYHAVALVLVGVLDAHERFDSRALSAAAIAFTSGIVLFCGSLYAYALGGSSLFGAVAPIGGLAFMVGWAALALAALSSPTRR